jgi:hypothetical protein
MTTPARAAQESVRPEVAGDQADENPLHREEGDGGEAPDGRIRVQQGQGRCQHQLDQVGRCADRLEPLAGDQHLDRPAPRVFIQQGQARLEVEPGDECHPGDTQSDHNQVSTGQFALSRHRRQELIRRQGPRLSGHAWAAPALQPD